MKANRLPITSIHIVPAISNESSGPSYSVTNLCQALINQGIDITLAALDWEHLDNPPAFLRTFNIGIAPRKLGSSPDMKRWLDAQVKSKNIDVIHSHGMWQMNALYAGWVTKNSNIEFVVSPRGAFSKWAMHNGSWSKKLFWPLLQKPAFKKVACFHATAYEEYQDIRRMGFKQPVAIIPNGIDIPIVENKKSTATIRTLLFLGRIHPVKGVDLLLRAWGCVQDDMPDWRLLIVGSDDGYHQASGYLEKMRTLSNQIGLERVEFAGKLEGADKWSAYKKSDLYVLPSHSENFGMTVAEALISETPAIVARGAPWGGLVEKNAGWWIDNGETPLVECLREALLLPPEKLHAMGKHGRQWMEAEFTWPHIGWKMSETYRWLLDRSSPVPEWICLD